MIGRWLLAILPLWPGAGTPQIVLLVQQISEQLLRRWNNQGAVRAGQQGRGGASSPSDLNHGMADKAASGRVTRYAPHRGGRRWRLRDRYRQASAGSHPRSESRE